VGQRFWGSILGEFLEASCHALVTRQDNSGRPEYSLKALPRCNHLKMWVGLKTLILICVDWCGQQYLFLVGPKSCWKVVPTSFMLDMITPKLFVRNEFIWVLPAFLCDTVLTWGGHSGPHWPDWLYVIHQEWEPLTRMLSYKVELLTHTSIGVLWHR